MASSPIATGSYTNLTRLELEQLRKADYASGGRALTIGDDGTLGGAGVGPGSIVSENYSTNPTVALDEVYTLTPPLSPGLSLGTITQDYAASSAELVRWYGPQVVSTGTAGSVPAGPGNTFSAGAGSIAVNDILVIKGSTLGVNFAAVATVSVVGAGNSLTLTNIVNPNFQFGGSINALDIGAGLPYAIVRPQVIQLFAVPGSGPLGREQTFFAVSPTSTLHTTSAPTVDQINADRILNLVPPTFSAGIATDRADAVFGPPNTGGPRSALDKVGYRMVLYLADGTGAPDLTSPIAQTAPVIDPSIATADQRMTIDYKAGIVRFSCAPAIGGDLKVTGGVTPATGRLALYAVFWAFDQTLTKGASRSVYALRSNVSAKKDPATLVFDTNANVWKLGSTASTNSFVVSALSASEDPDLLTQFGVLDPGTTTLGTSFRGFRYRSAANKYSGWTMVSKDITTPGDLEPSHEVQVGAKTELTLGDGTAPPHLPGLDYNPTGYYARGRRASAVNLQQALNAAAISGYGDVHLHRGQYDIDQKVYFPPGVTLRGEGRSTVLTSRKLGTATYAPSVFKFGPNTSWGVYDFTATPANGYSTPVTPTKTDWTLGTRLEGIHTVWNATRRVWGMFQADVTNNAVWFNEMRTDGTLLFTTPGIDIKANANALFSGLSVNSQNHTGGHYPRAAHHEYQDQYAVTWVEEQSPSGVVGPLAKLQVITVANFATTPSVTKMVSSAVDVTGSGTYSNHPSVAVDNSDSDNQYSAAVSFWSYSADLSITVIQTVTYTTGDGISAITPNTTLSSSPGSKAVVSSTDIKDDKAGSFLAVYSVRKHAPIFKTGSGLFYGGSFSDGSFASWSAVGVGIGSRISILSGTNAGSYGIVGFVSGGNLAATPENGIKLWVDETGLNWAITPPTYIASMHVTSTGLGGYTNNFTSNLTYTAPSSGTYSHAAREADFVRVARGSSSWCVVYQAMDSHSALSKPTLKNFDNALDALFLDSNGGTGSVLADTRLHREHIATCYMLLSDDGTQVVYPYPVSSYNALPNSTTPDAGSAEAKTRDIEVSTRSMGGRHLDLPYPNAMANTYRPSIEVSARNYYHPWSATERPSIIPDITWTGSEWIVVSPAKKRIRSLTGTYRAPIAGLGSGQFFLVDPTFYFGAGATASSTDNNYLHQTVTPGLDQIYFPSVGLYATISAVHSEHVVVLSAAVAGLTDGTTATEWILVKADPTNSANTSGAMKNAGFRISAEGKLLQGASYFTMADDSNVVSQATESEEANGSNPQLPRRQEVLNRKLWGDTTFSQFPYANPNNNPRYGAVALSAGPAGGFMQWFNLPGGRITGNLLYQGVAVGAPKGTNEAILGEPEMCSIAWGDNFYAFFDRVVSGKGVSAKQYTGMYRQTFGAWRSKIENLTLQGGQDQKLEVLSRNHVYTRHGYPTTGTVGFATDGYRNCFVHPYHPTLGDWRNGGGGSNGAGPTPEADQTYSARIAATYTGADGSNPISLEGPSIVGAYQREAPLNYLGLTTNAFMAGYPAYYTQQFFNKQNASRAKVFWTGKEFVAFIAAVSSDSQASGAPAFGDTASGSGTKSAALEGFIHMVRFPGGEDAGAQGNEITGGNLVDPYYAPLSNDGVAKIVATSKFWSGASLSGNLQWENAVCDVAFNGKQFAVLWTMGMNPTLQNTGNQRGGSIVGVTIFDAAGNASADNNIYEGGTPAGGRSYLLGATYGSTEYSSPKIAWDGEQFFATIVNKPGGGDGNLLTMPISPDGPGDQLRVKRINGRAQQTLGVAFSALGSGLGTTKTTAAATTGNPRVAGGVTFVSLSGNVDATLPQVGDTLFVSYVTNGTINNYKYQGFYQVVGFNPRTLEADIGVDLSDAGANNNYTVIGALFSGGPSTAQAIAHNNQVAPAFMVSAPRGSSDTFGAINASPIVASQKLSQRVERVWGMTYNEIDDEFCILYQSRTVGADSTNTFTTADFLCAATFKKSMMQVTREVVLRTDSQLSEAVLKWNGKNYLVAFTTGNVLSGGSESVYYMQLARTLAVEAPAVSVSNVYEAMGNGVNQQPGTLYGALTYSDPTSPRWRGLAVEWNAKMSRWAISASSVMYEDTSASVGSSNSTFAVRLTSINKWTPTAYSNRTITIGTLTASIGGSRTSDSTYVQPGTRWVVKYNDVDFTQGFARADTPVVHHIRKLTDSTHFEVITHSTEVSSQGVTDTVGGLAAYSASTHFYQDFFQFPREDVFVWTVGYKNPVIKVEDADDIELSDVTFASGSVDLEERRLRTAGPMWQVNGLTVGDPVGCYLSSNTGQTTALGTTFTDTSVNFTTSNVKPGDYLILGSGGSTGGNPYQILTVGTTTLTAKSLSSGTSFAASNISIGYYILRYNPVQSFPVRPRVNHLFLTPEGKSEGIRFSNVQSKTKAVYGSRTLSSLVIDRAAFGPAGKK